ncbi:Putative cysteine-rich receptor-like protein kinase 33 [Olea europaea subsp. europaea]|uniref:Cysteine-rich receptor-like protein kinase 33 n=1 Tax=Olea europaea subsp. europaea TaxID=158383 RepID=A0A8S0RK16_OLEEU|nr:Putative cysteine-rich receptor-like protein kinase 33 [Olea europaea subsp. europaea]
MARLFLEYQSHVNTRAAGTNGYTAPEYLMFGDLSARVDIFSFGVVVLELIGEQRNLTFNRDPNSRNLLEWVYRLYKQGRILETVDHTLSLSTVPDKIAMCIQLGLLCTQADPALRPNMHQVVLILSKKPSTLEEPTEPGFPGSRYRRTWRRTAHYPRCLELLENSVLILLVPRSLLTVSLFSPLLPLKEHRAS